MNTQNSNDNTNNVATYSSIVRLDVQASRQNRTLHPWAMRKKWPIVDIWPTRRRSHMSSHYKYIPIAIAKIMSAENISPINKIHILQFVLKSIKYNFRSSALKSSSIQVYSSRRIIWPYVYQGTVRVSTVSSLLDNTRVDQIWNHLLQAGWRNWCSCLIHRQLSKVYEYVEINPWQHIIVKRIAPSGSG